MALEDCQADPTCGGDNGDDPGFPPGSRPEDRRFRLSTLCSMGMTPRLMTGIIRQILLQHFVDPNQIFNPNLRDQLVQNGAWTSGPESGIYIEALDRWRPEMTEKRPALVIKEGDWTWERRGIGNQAGYDWRDGKQYYAGFWKGSHTVFAVGNEGAETQLLSWEARTVLTWYSPVIMDQASLHQFEPLRLGALQALDESTENYIIPIDYAYVAEETWSLQEDAPRLKKIVFDVDELVGYTGVH